MSKFEEVKVYSLLEDRIKLIRCIREVATGHFRKVTIDYIYDPYDYKTLQSQEAYFFIGLVGAMESSEAYDSLEELLKSYDEEGT